MSLKQPPELDKFSRAPALAQLRLRFRQQQDNAVMQNSPAVREMKKAQGGQHA